MATRVRHGSKERREDSLQRTWVRRFVSYVFDNSRVRYRIKQVETYRTESQDNLSNRILADIYLKDGKTVQVPWEEADEYIAANSEKLGYRQIQVGRPRAKGKQSQQ